jgi:hypothetical protein
MNRITFLAAALVVAAQLPAQSAAQTSASRGAPAGKILPTRLAIGLLGEIEKADINGDGDVTRQELKDARAAEFPRLDRNQDGFVSEADIPYKVKGRVDASTVARVVSEFDGDGDRKVSRKEFAAAPTVAFNQVDKDGNGIASRYELVAMRSELSGR